MACSQKVAERLVVHGLRVVEEQDQVLLVAGQARQMARQGLAEAHVGAEAEGTRDGIVQFQNGFGRRAEEQRWLFFLGPFVVSGQQGHGLLAKCLINQQVSLCNLSGLATNFGNAMFIQLSFCRRGDTR